MKKLFPARPLFQLFNVKNQYDVFHPVKNNKQNQQGNCTVSTKILS